MLRNRNVVALLKESGDRYVFLYDEESLPALILTLGRFAVDPELDFNWYDEAILSQKARKLAEGRLP